MSDNPLSNMPGRVTASADMLEAAVAELLRLIPETWQAYRPDDLSETKAQGLFLLTAAGLVERRERLRLRFAGHPISAEATITCTGEYGGFEAVEPLVANLWADWQDAVRAWKKGDTANVSPAHCERLEPSEWRLTPEGVIERKHLAGSERERRATMDFILQRGIYDRKPHVSPFNGRVFHQKPIRGKGALVKMDKTTADAAPAAVNIGNWGEGGDAFAQAFGPVIVKMFEAMQAQAKPAAPALPSSAAKPAGKRGRRKLSAKESNRRLEILKRWERASEAGVTREKFCDDEDITPKELQNFQDWQRQRENRQ
jgi:hypothetical protein